MKKIIDLLKYFNVSHKYYYIRHIFCFIPAAIFSISFAVFPNYIHLIIDNGVVDYKPKEIVFYGMLMILTGIIIVIADYGQDYGYTKFDLDLFTKIKQTFISRMFITDSSFMTDNKTGDLNKSILEDLKNISSTATNLIPSILVNLISILGVSYFLISYFSKFGLLIIFLSLILIITQKFYGDKIVSISGENRNISGEETSFLMEILANLDSIKMAGHTNITYQKLINLNEAVRQSNLKLKKTFLLANATGSSINTLILLIVITLGSIRVGSGLMSAGTLLALSIYSQRLASPLSSLIKNYMEIKSITPIILRTEKLLKQQSTILKGDLIPNEHLNEITISNLSFNYDSSHIDIFNNFNFNINEGEIIGITGGNGNGKSTLIKIIMKLCNYNKGKIMINQKYNLSQINVEYLHNNIAFLPQNHYLMSGSLRSVINPFGLDIEDDILINLLQQLNFKENLDINSLEYSISERFNNLSGGETQKIALARLIIEDKKWIILDEPTSAMDKVSEQIICNYLKNYLDDKTAIIITHRPEILNICHKIIELN